jgi:hypothetical protein
VALAALAVGRVGTAQGRALVHGDVVTDFRGLPDHNEAVVDEEIAPDGRTGVDVDAGHEPREVIDQPGEEEQPHPEQAVRHPVEAHRPDPGIEQHFPARTRGRIARDDRVDVADQA